MKKRTSNILKTLILVWLSCSVSITTVNANDKMSLHFPNLLPGSTSCKRLIEIVLIQVVKVNHIVNGKNYQLIIGPKDTFYVDDHLWLKNVDDGSSSISDLDLDEELSKADKVTDSINKQDINHPNYPGFEFMKMLDLYYIFEDNFLMAPEVSDVVILSDVISEVKYIEKENISYLYFESTLSIPEVSLQFAGDLRDVYKIGDIVRLKFSKVYDKLSNDVTLDYLDNISHYGAQNIEDYINVE